MRARRIQDAFENVPRKCTEAHSQFRHSKGCCDTHGIEQQKLWASVSFISMSGFSGGLTSGVVAGHGCATVPETPPMEAVKPSILCIRRKQMLTQLRKTLGNTKFLRFPQECKCTLYNIHMARAIAE